MNIEAPAVTLLEGRPLVTLVVACHGEGRYLDDCLRSLRAQHYRWLEIIVIDDAGHDDSAAVAAEHALADPRVVVVRLRRNVGLGAVRNYGLRAARGELIGFVDGDDLLPATSVPTRVRALADQLGDPAYASVPVAGVYGDWDYVAPAVDEHVPTGESRELVAIDLAASAGGNVFIVSAPLVRTDVLRATGGFAEAVTGGEDHIAWMRVLATGAVFVPCREVAARYRQKPTSMVRSSVAEYAALTAASRRILPHDTVRADPAGPAELADLSAGERTISFGVVEEQRPTMAALAPAAVAASDPSAAHSPEAHPRAGSDPQVPTPAAAPWPDGAPAGPPEGSDIRARITFGETLLASAEAPQRPDADVFTGGAGALAVFARPGDADGPFRRTVPAAAVASADDRTGTEATTISIGASSVAGGVAAMAAALVLDDRADDAPAGRATPVATLLLSPMARHAALAAAASWGRLPSALEIAATADAATHLQVHDRRTADGRGEVCIGLAAATDARDGADHAAEIDAAALVAQLTDAPPARSGTLVVISHPGAEVEAIRSLLARADAAAPTAVEPTRSVAAGSARAARVLADHGVAVRVAGLVDLAAALHVVTDDPDVAWLAAAVGTAATVFDADGTLRAFPGRRTGTAEDAAPSQRLAELMRRAGDSADRRDGEGGGHDSTSPPR